MQQILPSIDPDAADPFDPYRFFEDTMKYVHPKAGCTAVLPEYLIARIDLFKVFLGLVVLFPFLTKLSTGFSTIPISLQMNRGLITH